MVTCTLWACIFAFSWLSPQGSAPQHLALKKTIAVPPIEWGTEGRIGDWELPDDFKSKIDEMLREKLRASGEVIVLDGEELEAWLAKANAKNVSSAKGSEKLPGNAAPEKTADIGNSGTMRKAQTLVASVVKSFGYSNLSGISIALPGIGHVKKMGIAKVSISVRAFDADTSDVIVVGTANGTSDAEEISLDKLRQIGTSFESFEKSAIGKATLNAVDRIAELILKKLKAAPWQAEVVTWDGTKAELTIAAGEEAGLKVGDLLDVYRVTRVDPSSDSDAPISRLSWIGSLRLKTLDKRTAVGTVGIGTNVQVGDIVRQRKE